MSAAGKRRPISESNIGGFSAPLKRAGHDFEAADTSGRRLSVKPERAGAGAEAPAPVGWGWMRNECARVAEASDFLRSVLHLRLQTSENG